MRKAVVEIRLESGRACLDIPGAVLHLSVQQELNTALVCGIRYGQSGGLQRNQRFTEPETKVSEDLVAAYQQKRGRRAG